MPDFEHERMGKREGKKFTLFLVSPFQQYKHFGTQVFTAKLVGRKNANTSLALPILAALTPDYYHIGIFDEELTPIPIHANPDIVGITTHTPSVHRAYQIASMFRERGAKVILGGPHVTYEPEEGLEHADSVVIGEAEELWGKCLADFEQGKLQEIYQSEQKIDFSRNVLPRWDLVDTSNVLSLSVQATRGCPYKCEFCIVSKMFGRKVRYRDIDNVVEEVAALPIRNILFVDDNLTINKKYALELVRGIKPCEITWTCQASLDVADDEELLKEMAEAGCRFIILGLESVNPESIKETKKFQNKAEHYLEAIRRINRVGIQVYSSFIVGFDHDTLEEFNNIYQFTIKAELPYVMISILGTHEGTDLHERMKKEGRLVQRKAKYTGGMFPVLHYMQMSQLELFDKYHETMNRLYTWESIGERAFPLFEKGFFIRTNKTDQSGFFFKFKMTFNLFGIYLFSRDKYKRQAFLKMIDLIRKDKIAIESAAIFLVSMEGFRRHLQVMKKNLHTFRDEIKLQDKGAWKEQMEDQK